MLLYHLAHSLCSLWCGSVLVSHLLEGSIGARLGVILTLELLLYSNSVARDTLDLVLVLHLSRCSACLILLSVNLEML